MFFVNLEKRLATFQALSSTEREDVGSRMRRLHATLCWYWLKWHLAHQIDSPRLQAVDSLRRALTALPPREKDDLRPQLDSFLIQLAILAGNRKLTLEVCDTVLIARPSARTYQHLEAWNGVLKWTLLDDLSKAQEQFDILQKHSPLKTFEWASHTLVEAFLSRDWKKFNKQYKAASEKHSKAAEKEGAVLHREADDVTIDIKMKHMNFLWPWPTAVFGRLAVQTGAEIDFDSPWLPQAFLS